MNMADSVKTRVEEISKVIDFHRKKYFKEQHDIGIFSPTDDLMTYELSVRFKEPKFFVIALRPGPSSQRGAESAFCRVP